MRIGIDGRFLATARGIGGYVYELLQAYAETTRDFTIAVYTDSNAAQRDVPKDARFTSRVLKPHVYPLWEQIALPFAAARDKLDVLHCTGNTAPVTGLGAIPLVLTVHDAMFRMPPRIVPAGTTAFERAQRAYYSCVSPRAAHRAAAIITDSLRSKSDLNQYLGLEPARMTVIHLAPRSPFRPLSVADAERSKEKFGIGGEYFLAMAALDPRKNTERLIAAYAMSGLSQAVKLVLCGAGSSLIGRLKRRLPSEYFTGVVTLPYVDDADLAALLNGCLSFIYPSHYEGFGLPVVEAMRCGAAVICAKAGALDEVAGTAALYVDPLSQASIAAAMVRVHDDPQVVTGLRERARAFVQRYSWQSTAVKTLQVYDSVLQRSGA